MQKLFKNDKDYVIYIDTDSVMVSMSDVVKKMGIDQTNISKTVQLIDKFCQDRFNNFIDEAMKELAEYANAFEHTVFFKREKIVDRALFLAKKRYIMSVWNSEGVTYQKSKLKIMGIDLIKASVPAVCRKKAKELIPFILQKRKTEVETAIANFRKEFLELPVEAIAFPRTANGLNKYAGRDKLYQKGCPIHVRAALIYNYLIKKFNLEQQYELIKDGEKVRYVFLRMPNVYQENVIGFVDTFPKEFGLDTLIDREEQFHKSFLHPFNSMTDCLQWRLDPQQASLEDFFG